MSQDKYTFVIVINDSNDEFSEKFNPKDTSAVNDFEWSMRESLEEMNWTVESVTLKKVEVTL